MRELYIRDDQLSPPCGRIVERLGLSKLTPSLRFDNRAGFFQPSIRGIGTGVTTSGGGWMASPGWFELNDDELCRLPRRDL